MKKRLTEIEHQIDRLQKEAKSIRAEEVADVVQRIRSAIEHYGLGIEDLFDARQARAAGRKTGRKGGRKKTVGAIRYRDAEGHQWTGHGKRPNWFKAAIESGKTLEELSVKP
ncbi:MAG: H-NS histone family protein [Caldimonas sp.]